jgi:hypothetical protein
MKIPPLHYAVVLLSEDFNMNASQISERLEMSLRYVYKIKNTYREGATLTPDYEHENTSHTSEKRKAKYVNTNN